MEKQLYDALIAARDHLDYCGWGDSWERECALQPGGVADQVEQAIANYDAQTS